MKLKNLLSLMLAAAMLLTCIPAYAEPSPERETLTILMADDSLVTDFKDNAFTQYLEEAMNVNLEFILLPQSEAATKLQIMIASGEELPDVINYNLDVSTVYAYAQAGAIIPLDEYYETQSVNLRGVVEAHPEYRIMEAILAPDGHLYSIPSYLSELHSYVAARCWINETWLKNLNLQMPTTPDEFYQVLKAFKEQDANGNGDPDDEIPMIGAWTGMRSTYNVLIFLMNAFCQADFMNFLTLENDTVGVAYNTEGWREGLKFVHKLVAEGLIDPASFTQDGTQYGAVCDNNGEGCIVGCYTVQTIKPNYTEEFTALPPLTGPEGVQGARYTPATASNRWFVTSDCKNPELAFKLGDFIFNEDVFKRIRLGVEGEDWLAPEEGAESIYPGCDAEYISVNDMWNDPQNHTWRQSGPIFSVTTLQGEAATETTTLRSIKNAQGVMEYIKYAYPEGTYIPFMNYTEEENYQISDILNSLNTYVSECMVRFATGDMDIEKEWDAYLAELDNIGLQTYLKVTQDAYNRTK